MTYHVKFTSSSPYPTLPISQHSPIIYKVGNAS